MPSLRDRLHPFGLIVFILFTWAALEQCDNTTSSARGERKAMHRYNIGRFSIAIPAMMEEKLRSSKLRYVELKEIVWAKEVQSDRVQTEWERFMTEVKKLKPPEGKDRVIIKEHLFHGIGKWTKGIFYYSDVFDSEAAQWSLLVDSGANGVWLVGDPTVVEEEQMDPKMAPNIETVARSYQPLPLADVTRRPDNRFYLQHGAINLPYSEQEDAIARFDGHPLDLTLLIEMETDFTKERETKSLINGTRAFLAAALIAPGGGASKVRLRKREVAGMPGEEAVLKIREGDTKNLVFTWQYNGKDNSGEYPATKIEMQSPAGHLGEKLEIWDAILDSMKPMFERKKS